MTRTRYLLTLAAVAAVSLSTVACSSDLPSDPAPITPDRTVSAAPTTTALDTLTADERQTIAIYVSFARSMVDSGAVTRAGVTAEAVAADLVLNYDMHVTEAQAAAVRDEILEDH
jgi:septal ring-binding cell division protein DamX